MAARQLVGDGGCGTGSNPLAGFMHSMEKRDAHSRQFQSMGMQLPMGPQDAAPPHAEEYLASLESGGPLHMPLLDRPDGLLAPVPPTDVHADRHFHFALRDLVHSVLNNAPPPLATDVPVQVDPAEVPHVSERLGVLMRQCSADPHQMEDSLMRARALLTAAGIPALDALSGPKIVDPATSWLSEYSSFAPPATHARNHAAFNRAWEDAGRHREWVSDYQRPNADLEWAWRQARTDYRDLETVYEKTRPDTRPEGEKWAEEYNTNTSTLDEDREEAEWFSKFLPGGTHFQAPSADSISHPLGHAAAPLATAPLRPGEAWSRNAMGREWASSYAGSNADTSTSTTATAPRMYPSEAEQEDYDRVWAGGMGSNPGGARTGEVIDQVEGINDPKLQMSNFMQFLRQVKRGEFSLEDDGPPPGDGV